MSKEIKRRMPVSGMMCGVCAGTVQKTLQELKGVKEAEVSFADQSALVSWDPAVTSPETMAEAVKNAGYELIYSADEEEAIEAKEKLEQEQYRAMKRKVTLAWVLTVPIVAVCMTHIIHSTIVDWGVGAMTLLVMLVCGGRFYTVGFRNLFRGHASMESLVAVSTAVSFLLSLFTLLWSGYWEERGLGASLYFEGASMIVTFVLTGKLLELRARHSAGSALRGLMQLQPDVALRKKADGATELIRSKELRKGDIVMVKPGSHIPADGVVCGGEARVNESMLSGEPMSVLKKNGSEVHAGTVTESGSIEFRVSHTGASTLLGGIIARVREAQAAKAPVQRMVDKVSAFFVPTVMGIALITFLVWWIVSPENIALAILAGVSVLVISCPCALGLATPTAIMVGMGRGARQGILMRDATALEKLGKIRTLCIDKTGTLTQGEVAIEKYHIYKSSEKEIAEVLLSLENRSEHPLARSLCRWAEEHGAESRQCSGFTQLAGEGVEGEYDGKRYWIGSSGLAKHKGTSADRGFTEEAEAKGASVVAMGTGNELLAMFAVADTVRPESAAVVKELSDLGIEVVLLTGDAEAPARYIASQTGIEKVQARLLPADKAEVVKELRRHGPVAMVGDGVNDAPALAQADVSVALSTGTDIAMDVAGITLVGGTLKRLPDAIRLSRRTVRVIHQNLFWAFIYNVIGIPLAAGLLYPAWGILLNPMIASAAMAMSSVCVVTNSLRLRK